MSEKLWTSLELIRWTTGYFEEHGIATPRLDAELLLAHALGVDRISLYTGFDKPVVGEERSLFRDLVRERAQRRVPVAYLTGRREFWSREFRVSPAVLIPRPDTETLVRAAVGLEPDRIAEIGVGSGAVSAALALERADARLVVTDCSHAALEVAAANFEALGVSDRIELLECDGLDGLEGCFDVIVSNPPYIPTAELDRLGPEIQHEPRLALDGGEDGLDMVRQLAASAPDFLAPGGSLLIEIGSGQFERVRSLMEDSGALEVVSHPDLAGIERVVQARFTERRPPQ